MSTSRPFAFNTGTTISNTTQLGNLAIGVNGVIDYSQNYGGVEWWSGPDEDTGYVIAYPSDSQPTNVGRDAKVQFWRSSSKTDQSFIDIGNYLSNNRQNFTSVGNSGYWLQNNNYWSSYPTTFCRFNSSLGQSPIVSSIGLQSDGKILVGGQFSSYGNISANGLIRLNSDGTYDNTFTLGLGLGVVSTVETINVQSDGKILIGGDFSIYNSNFNRIVRLNSDGTIDNTFIIGSGFNDTVESIEVQSDGKILVGGTIYII